MRLSSVSKWLLVLLTFSVAWIIFYKPTFGGHSIPKGKEYNRSVNFVCSGDNQEELVDGIRFVFYIICHDEKSLEIAKKWSKCMPWSHTVLVPPSVFFESAAYSTVFPTLEANWKSADVIGVATYKSLKFLSLEKLSAYVELAFYRPYDIVPLYTSGEYLVPQAVKGHTHEFQMIWETTLQSIVGLSVDEIKSFDKIEVFFRNTFLISPKWFRLLIDFMSQSMHKVQSDKALTSLLKSDAHYAEGKLPVAQAIFHQDYYEWFPFVFERLPSFFFHYAGAKVFGTLRQVSLFENADPDMKTLYKGL